LLQAPSLSNLGLLALGILWLSLIKVNGFAVCDMRPNPSTTLLLQVKPPWLDTVILKEMGEEVLWIFSCDTSSIFFGDFGDDEKHICKVDDHLSRLSLNGGRHPKFYLPTALCSTSDTLIISDNLVTAD
jgi:hypothetical protein